MYDGVKSEMLSTTKFDENSDLNTTHLDMVDMTRIDKIKAEENFPISEQGYTVGEPLDGTDLLLVADDVVPLDLFKNDDSVHIYAKKMQPNRPKRDRKKKTFSPIESGSIN